RQVCYAGISGTADQSGCEINRQQTSSGADISVKTSRGLNAFETLTFVTAFNKDTFQQGPEVAHEQKVHKLRVAGASLGVGLPPLLAFAFMFGRWRKFGNDPRGRGVIVPEYEPPKGLTALTSDFLLQEKLRNLALSAAIIELATNRYITIYEIIKNK